MSVTHLRTWLLLSLAALGAAGMFLVPDGWFGIDVGPLGSALVYTALWLFVLHLSRHSDAAFPQDSPLAERQAWVALGFVVLIAINYLNFMAALSGMGEEGNSISNRASRPFGVNLGMLIFAWILIAGVVRAKNPDTVELDERDLRIQHAAGRLADGLMTMLIIGAVATLAIWPEQMREFLRPLLVANALLGLLILRTLTENIHIVGSYWRERR